MCCVASIPGSFLVCYLPGVLYYSTALQYVTQAREEPGSEVTVSPHLLVCSTYTEWWENLTGENFHEFVEKGFSWRKLSRTSHWCHQKMQRPQILQRKLTNAYKTSCSILCDTNCSVQLRQAQVFFQVKTSASMVF